MTVIRVGHLDTRIRAPDATSPLATRLDDVARERLPAALERSVARALPIADEVLVLRHVDVGVELETGASAGPEELAARWAEAAGASAAAIAGGGDADDVVRFADEARFVASFVGDLLAGRAWDRWYYGAFAGLRDLSVAAAIARLLADHAAHLSDILGTLRRDGTLERALSALGVDESRAVWAAALGTSPRPLDAASALPIAAAALDLAARLRLRGHAPEPAQLAAAHARWAPEPLDWTGPDALADGVFAAFAEVAGTAAAPFEGPGLRAAVAAAVGDLDWLDRDRLAARIVALLDRVHSDALLSHADPDTAAPRQVLAALARDVGVELEPGSAGVSASAIRLLAALAVRDPRLAASPGAVAEIERLLSEGLSGGARSVGLSPSRSADSGKAIDSPWRRCDAAGVLLLSRAFADVRLGGLASRLALPSPGLAGDRSAALLLSVALSVAGPDGVDADGQLDPALMGLLARDDVLTAAALAEAWSATASPQHRALRDELSQLARAQRLDRCVPVAACRHPALPGLARGTVARAAHLALMAWARWLPGLEGSSPAFLLGQLLRRGGWVAVALDAVHVVLDPRPLDAVVELAGYLEPLERVPWLEHRGLRIRRGTA